MVSIIHRLVFGSKTLTAMELRLKYGDGILSAAFPDFPSEKMKGNSRRPFAELHSQHIATLQKPADILAQALDRPLGCHPFNQVFRGARNVLLVVPDPSEAGGSEHYLPMLCERLHRLHVPNEELKILIAQNDARRLPALAHVNDYAAVVGEKVRVFRHDPRDSKALEYVGLTRRGTPVFVNRLILDADEVILCGSVTHHSFAGYGGGPRLFVPGCAGHETAARHHALAIDPEALRVHPRCRDGVVEGNPLQEDAREAFRFVSASFLLHTLFNDQGQMIGAVAGEPLQAFAGGCRLLDDMMQVPVAQPASLVIVSGGGFPFDSDFRSVHAALHRASQVVRPGGVIVFVAECRHGLGSPALSRWLEEVTDGAETGAHLLPGSKGLKVPSAVLSGHQRPDWRSVHHRVFHHVDVDALIALATLQEAREVRIIAVTALDAVTARRLGFTPASSLPEALALAITWLPDIFSAFVISNGTLLLPHLC
jgi:nickel-dependent lactate racemase